MKPWIDEVFKNIKGLSGPDSRGWYTGFCPFHEDKRRPNLRLRESGFKCMTCGEKGNLKKLAAKLGIVAMKVGKPPMSRIKETYDYPDEMGNLLYQVVRYEPKAFKQRRPDGKGNWIWNLDNVRRVLYCLPDLVASPKDKVVYHTEGEKDARALQSLGLVATCNPGGAGKFTLEMREPLKSRPVVIIADKDEPGRRNAQQVAAMLYGFAAWVKVLELPGDMVKDAADWVAAGGTGQDLEKLVAATQTWVPPQGSGLLDDIVTFIRRFVVLSLEQIELLALWIIHTYLLSAADVTPYINISSSEKRSGKTLLLEILEMLVHSPWLTGRITAAVLARKVHAECPTLLLDESDAAFNSDQEYSWTLRGILNTGYRRGGRASVCVGQGTHIEYKDLSTFCPKAIAGIGKLPDTVADRSIPIRLKRRAPDEHIERFRLRKVKLIAADLQNRIVALATIIEKTLEGIEPDIPDSLNDRAADCIEPLLAIADVIGGDWPTKSRYAALSIMGDESNEDESLGVKLLADIRDIFEEEPNQISSGDLIPRLVEIEESPWGDIKGKPINTIKLAALLRPYGIRPGTIRIGDKTPKGYRAVDFADAWRRYLPKTNDKPATPQQSGVATHGSNPQQLTLKVANVAGQIQSRGEAKCCGVAGQMPEYGKNGAIRPENTPPETACDKDSQEWEAEI